MNDAAQTTGTVIVYHGTIRPEFAAHIGQCWTDSLSSAITFGEDGRVTEAALDLDGLTVLECEAYEAGGWAPGDHGDARSADVLVYQDSDYDGHWMVCYRLMTSRAVGALRDIETVETADAEDTFGDLV